ncbi:MAG: hypothetical protein WC455_24955 [Dehalococcoidia bacterium]|jgi:hypothetical protein
MKYDDLLSVPYLKNGRTLAGLDCYGLVIECFKREGKVLKDLALPEYSPLAAHVASLNVREASEPRPGLGVQFMLDGDFHIGYMIDRRSVLHMTLKGMRLTPIIALSKGNPKYFEVIE